MDSPLNAEQECCLCQSSCNSLNDLKNHLQYVHNLKKSERDVYVKLSIEEKQKKKEEGENVLEREDESFFKENEGKEEEIKPSQMEVAPLHRTFVISHKRRLFKNTKGI